MSPLPPWDCYRNAGIRIVHAAPFALHGGVRLAGFRAADLGMRRKNIYFVRERLRRISIAAPLYDIKSGQEESQ
jgi:hypothetical protein